MSFEFKNKAKTLIELQDQLETARVLPLEMIRIAEFNSNAENIWLKVTQLCGSKSPLIVRSCFSLEDLTQKSNAGKFTSVANVIDKEGFFAAVKEVIASYENCSEEEYFFVQPQLQDVDSSGVAFSHDPNTGGRYFVINYDCASGNTDTVTSGSTNELKLTYIAHGAKLVEDNQTVHKVSMLLHELIRIIGNQPIDIEFAISGNQLYLLQVRPLFWDHKTALCDIPVEPYLQEASNRFSQITKRHPYLLGDKTILGVMPDWNPAEIIGVKPKPLSLSLYRELITDNIWAYQRDNYGYRELRSFPLMIDFFGMPYIDSRVSFNSFIPAKLDENIAEKLVNYYIECLEKSPYLHDKVEFEIVFSAYTFDLENQLEILLKHGFTKSEISQIYICLRDLTNSIIGNQGLWRKDIEKLSELKRKQYIVGSSDLTRVEKIFWLMEDCKRYGTLPFAGLARAGFIAVQVLESMVSTKILSENEKNLFMSSLNTVTSSLSTDLQNLTKEDFLVKYGHLRPGTYDILSPRYDEAPDNYFNWAHEYPKDTSLSADFAVTIDSLNKINKVLKRDNIDLDAVGLFNFIRSAIEGREYAKFIFTRSLSKMLALVGDTALEFGLSKEAASFLNINVFKESYISTKIFADELNTSVNKGKKEYEISQTLRLPPLITNENEFWQFDMPCNHPNFVTKNTCLGAAIRYSNNKQDINEKILFIENADPGFDWIFSHNIKGFVTQFGGSNSHMAIRANELGIPAVIGSGEVLFQKWLDFGLLEIDCGNRLVRSIFHH